MKAISLFFKARLDGLRQFSCDVQETGGCNKVDACSCKSNGVLMLLATRAIYWLGIRSFSGAAPTYQLSRFKKALYLQNMYLDNHDTSFLDAPEIGLHLEPLRLHDNLPLEETRPLSRKPRCFGSIASSFLSVTSSSPQKTFLT